MRIREKLAEILECLAVIAGVVIIFPIACLSSWFHRKEKHRKIEGEKDDYC